MCGLERDLHRRLRDIGDARLELMSVASGEDDTSAAPATGTHSRRSTIILTLAFAVVAATITELGV